MASSSTIENQLEQSNPLREDDRKVLEDFYWLRFLELEAQGEAMKKGSVCYKKLDKMGQSIFTVTKRLRKETENENFGFEDEIVWTKPCFIKGIAEDSPAGRSHLEPGDFIIFIDKVNVVDRSKSEILSIINKSDSLTLEVFRRTSIKMQIQTPGQAPKITPSRKSQASIKIKNQKSILEENVIEIESISKPAPSDETSTIDTIVDTRKSCKLVSKGSTESKKKQLVTFSKDESTTTSCSNDSQRSYKLLNNLLQCERQFIESLNFGAHRYIEALRNRKDLLSSKEHEILFKNIESIHVVMEKLFRRDNPEKIIQTYKENMNIFLEEYEKYFSTIKAADSIIVDKTHHPEFIKFIANPSIPNNQPLFHNFLHKPLDYYTDLQKNLQIMLGQHRIDSQEYRDLNHIINKLQSVYGEAMSKAAENKVEAKPLLLNLESRIVFTKCKPFKLDVPGRTMIFGGDLIRIEGNSMEKPAYTLLFNDIILFSTINRDRVLFITEEPISLKSIVETFFNIRKRENEFRLTIETNPNYKDVSPTTHCTPDLIKSPLRQSKRRNIYLRAPSVEVKKVWQNFITQQVFNINSISPSSNNLVDAPNVSLLNKNPSTQTDIYTNISTKKKETESICSSFRSSNIYNHTNSNHLNLKSQKAFDLGGSLEKIISDADDDGRLETPETPSCANLSSLNGQIQKSLSALTFSSVRNFNSDCGESCDDIFNDFESADLSFSADVKECMFMQNDPFFADES